MRVVLPASMWAMMEILRRAEIGCFSACGAEASATCQIEEVVERWRLLLRAAESVETVCRADVIQDEEGLWRAAVRKVDKVREDACREDNADPENRLVQQRRARLIAFRWSSLVSCEGVERLLRAFGSSE